MKSILAMALILLGSCKEFYDEEFEEFEATAANNVQDITYNAELTSTDQTDTKLSGSATVDVRNDLVTVDIQVSGVPENLIQLHYSINNAPCASYDVSLTSDSISERTFEASETITVNALATDLASSGAATSSGDINLRGKSFIIKSFSNFSGLPNQAGTNQLTIACGELSVQDGAAPFPFPANDEDVFAPGDPAPDPFPFPTEGLPDRDIFVPL